MLVIIENVPSFPLALLESVFGDMYSLDSLIFDATDFGSPARRRRLYVVMTLRGKLVLGRPLSELMGVLRSIFVARRSWGDLFCLDGADDCFTAAVARRAAGYMRRFGDRNGVSDLDQLPDGRPRRATAGLLRSLLQPTRSMSGHRPLTVVSDGRSWPPLWAYRATPYLRLHTVASRSLSKRFLEMRRRGLLVTECVFLAWGRSCFGVSPSAVLPLSRRSLASWACWDTSSVTNTNSMFMGRSAFNQLVCWNMASATDMRSLFRSNSAFDQPIGRNTSSVTNWSSMFRSNSTFSLQIVGSPRASREGGG